MRRHRLCKLWNKCLWACFAAGVVATFATVPVSAADVVPGTVIDKSNFDQMATQTFEGVRIGDAIPERLKWMIRNWGQKLTLEASRPWPKDPRVEALTKEYSGNVRLNPANNEIDGYVAGVPFPDIDWKNDPQAGWKAAWNFRYGKQAEDSVDLPHFMYVLTDGTKGVEREQEWYLFSHQMIGVKRAGVPPVAGDGKIFNKSIIAALAPQDVKGIGVFTIRYTSGQLDDTWAYVRAVRRTRRLSGGAWVDPIGGTDQLNDDFNVINAHPAWYTGFKILSKQKIFAIADVKKPIYNKDGKTPAERYQGMDVTTAPYWNLNHPFQLRDVYVIEGTTPTYHPYSKKIFYLVTDTAASVFGEFYDRKGDLWKTIIMAHKCWCGSWRKNKDFGEYGVDDASRNIVYPINGVTADYQRLHATTFVAGQIHYDSVAVTPDFVSLGTMEAQAR